jgi:hypothetical protein
VTGKNKGKFRKVGEKRSQFSRVHLIVQARRKKEGKSGLYGASMRAVAGKFAQRAQISVGFVKSDCSRWCGSSFHSRRQRILRGGLVLQVTAVCGRPRWGKRRRRRLRSEWRCRGQGQSRRCKGC